MMSRLRLRGCLRVSLELCVCMCMCEHACMHAEHPRQREQHVQSLEAWCVGITEGECGGGGLSSAHSAVWKVVRNLNLAFRAEGSL